MGGKATGGEQKAKKSATTEAIRHVGELTPQERKLLAKKFRKDERNYSLGVFNVILLSFLVGRYPQHYWVLHNAQGLILLPWRWFNFRAEGLEWYMLDFCYFNAYYAFIACVATLGRLYLGIFTPLHPYRAILLKAGFVYAAGSLAISVIFFGNRLTFHDREAVTSVYLHLGPSMLMWCIRWGAGFGPSIVSKAWPDLFQVCPPEVSFEAMDSCVNKLWCHVCEASLFEMTIIPFVLHLFAWGIPYYLICFVLFRDKLNQKQSEMPVGKYVTLYHQLTINNPKLARLVDSIPPPLLPAAYVCIHAFIALSFGALCYVWWNSFVGHTMLLVGLLVKVIHNGSRYNFQKFGMDYAQNMLKRHPSVALPNQMFISTPQRNGKQPTQRNNLRAEMKID